MRIRRLVLGALCLAAMASPALAGGCAGGFAPISKIDGLRVLSVQADAPYAEPGQEVTFEMTWTDRPGKDRKVTVVWLAGCFDPDGDQYYGCYTQLAETFSGLAGGQSIASLLQTGLVGVGDTFTLKLPEDIISRRPKPTGGAPHYGIAYVFFAACAGKLGQAPAEGTSLAGSFPLGCFDADGNQLGADSFVPGFTQVYAFADHRTNANPVIAGMTLGDKDVDVDPAKSPKMEPCPVTEDDRLAPPGCGRADPVKECTTYDVSVTLDESSLEIDPSGKQADGSPLHEIVWVDYFADRGDFQGDTRLIVDATTGVQEDWAVTYIPPREPGEVKIWAVVHDARGGQDVIERTLEVKTP